MAPSETPADGQRPRRPERAPSYRPWAELLARTFAVDVLACAKCQGRIVLRRQALGEEDDAAGRSVQETA